MVTGNATTSKSTFTGKTKQNLKEALLNKTTAISWLIVAGATVKLATDALSGTFSVNNDLLPLFAAVGGVGGVTLRAAIAKVEALLQSLIQSKP